MHVPVGYAASATVKRRGSFSCAHCKHWQRAEIVGIGGGGASLLAGGETAQERAQVSAARNGDRMLRHATCPKCHRRNGLGAFIGRYALMFGTIAALMLLLGLVYPVLDHSFDPDEAHFARTWGQLIMDGFVMLIVVPSAIAEWRKLDRRVRWLEF